MIGLNDLVLGVMAVAASASNDRWYQRAVEKLGQLQCDAVPWLSQKLALPVDMRTSWLGDRPTAAAAGACKLHGCCGAELAFSRCQQAGVGRACPTGYACLDLMVPEGTQLDSQQLRGLLSACLGKDR